MKLVSIVEGDGEVEAVPVLLRRLCAVIAPSSSVEILKMIRLPRTKLRVAGELERAVELAARKSQPRGAVLVLMDADDDCPLELAGAISARIQGVYSQVPKGIVLAKREFEAWFLAAAESLAGHRGLPPDLVPPRDPEAVSGAKEWLSRAMGAVRSYRETLDQPALAARMDLGQARACRSFRKLESELKRLLEAAAAGP